jgi:hypothetical protein
VRDLTPNSPQGRFEHLLRQFWGKRYTSKKGDTDSLNGVLFDTFGVTISLLGAEERVRPPDTIIWHEPGSLTVQYRMDEIYVERIRQRLEREVNQITASKGAQAALKRLGVPYEYKPVPSQGRIVRVTKLDDTVLDWSAEDFGLADLVLQVVRLPEHAPADFLISWVARELMKIGKSIVDAQTRGATHRDYYDAVHTLVDKAPAIAQWAKETRTDIGKVDLAAALEAISTYKFKESLVEQGTVVYTYKDGWTVQDLRTKTALAQEGKQMQNCIGGYCEDVLQAQTSRIYSIRDPSGQPHVSMELSVPLRYPSSGTIGVLEVHQQPEEFIESKERLACYFTQILGKQNDMPIDEYRERAREFIDKVFVKEGLGWCLTGGTPKWGRFAGRVLSDLNFPEIIGTNHVGEDAFTGADFTGATLARCVFGTLDMSHTNFDRADLTDARLAHTRLNRASFEGAKCHFADFSHANCADVSFDSAHLGGAEFTGTDLIGARFRDAKVDGASFINALGTGANWEGVELNAVQKDQLGMRAHWAALGERLDREIAAGGRRV